jgi:hypothetical protein
VAYIDPIIGNAKTIKCLKTKIPIRISILLFWPARFEKCLSIKCKTTRNALHIKLINENSDGQYELQFIGIEESLSGRKKSIVFRKSVFCPRIEF